MRIIKVSKEELNALIKCRESPHKWRYELIKQQFLKRITRKATEEQDD